MTASIVRREQPHATDVRPATGAVHAFKRSVIDIVLNHRLQITAENDWTELEELVQAMRVSKLKNAASVRRIFVLD